MKLDKPEFFISKNVKFYKNVYLKIWNAQENFNKDLEYLFYINVWGIAESLAYPLLMSPIKINLRNFRHYILRFHPNLNF